MGVSALQPVITRFAQGKRFKPERALTFADEAAPTASPLDQIAGLAGQPLGLLVGPEGGFSSDERDLLRAQSFVTPFPSGLES